MLLGIDPKVDYAFKRVFGDQRNADILIHLVNAVLKLSEPIVSVEVLNPFNAKAYDEDKLTILDIKARDQLGRLFNIEMQLLLPLHFPARILHYWAGLFREQLAEGDGYEQLRPTFSICFVDRQMFPDVNDYHLQFALIDPRHNVCFSDLVQIHMLELPKFSLRLEDLRDPLDKWLYFFRNAETMDIGELPNPFHEAVYEHAAQELAMLTQDQIERERYESRLRAVRDQRSLLQESLEQGRAEGRAEGKAEGLEEGVARGLEKGEIIGRISQCEELLNQPATAREELALLTADELQQRLDELRSKLKVR